MFSLEGGYNLIAGPPIEVPLGTPDAVPIEYTQEEVDEIGEPDENEVHLICPSSPYFEC